MADAAAYHSELVARIRRDVSFLYSVNGISLHEKDQILELLPEVPEEGAQTPPPATPPARAVPAPPRPASVAAAAPARAVPPPPTPPVSTGTGSKIQPPWMRRASTSAVQQVAPTSAPALPPRRQDEGSGQLCKALWDYHGGQSDDLPFRKGDIIRIVKEENEHWWRGEMNGREGLFPSNHAERLPAGAILSRPASSPYLPPTLPSPSPPGYAVYTPPSERRVPPTWQPPPPPPPPPEQAKKKKVWPFGGDKEKDTAPAYVPAPPPPPPPPPPQPQPTGEKKKFGGKVGEKMGNSFVHGVGFGAGTAVAGRIVGAIL